MKPSLIFAIAISLLCTSCLVDSKNQVPTPNPIDEYREQLAQDIHSEGTLFCETDSGGETVEYDTCASFDELRDQGCFGSTTVEMGRENHYALLCQEYEILENAKSTETSFFNLETVDWWQSIPAEVIPLRGGIYTAESAEQHMIEHQELITGRSLGEMDFDKVTASPEGLEAHLTSKELDCGSVVDFFSLNIVLLADLDGDGIAELLVQGYRAYQSETCHLGSGNFLGAEYLAVINKDSALDKPLIIPFLGFD